MSICPNVTEEDLNNWAKLAEQQKNQIATKIKNKTHKKLAESFEPIAKKFRG